MKNLVLFASGGGSSVENIAKVFQDEKKTLTDKQVDKVMSKLRQKFIDEFNAELRQ